MGKSGCSLSISLFCKAYLFKSVYHGCLNTLAHQKNIQKYEQEQLSDFYFSTVIQSPEAEEVLWKSDIEEAILGSHGCFTGKVSRSFCFKQN